jgi:hypothetical protein
LLMSQYFLSQACCQLSRSPGCSYFSRVSRCYCRGDVD